MLLVPLPQYLPCRAVSANAVEAAVGLVHVVHIEVRRVVAYPQLRIHGLQLHQAVGHREYAAYHDGGACVDMSRVAEHLGEALHHPSGNVAVLLRSEQCQLSPSFVALPVHGAHLVEHVAAHVGELAFGFGLSKDVNGAHIIHRVDEEARAVAPVVADVARRVALWCRGELPLLGAGIGQVVACREFAPAIDVGQRLLRKSGKRKQQCEQ